MAVLALVVVAGLSCARRGSGEGRSPKPAAAGVLEPPGLTAGERRPLVIFLHGLGGSGQDAVDDLGLGRFGARHRVFVVAPDGTPDRQGRRFWNAGRACCNFDGVALDDVERLSALIAQWRQWPGVDPRRVYVVGFSNGGFMAHLLACRISDSLAAVASLAGGGPDPRQPCAVSSPIGVLEVHGDADPVVRYQGGRVFDSPVLGEFPSMVSSVRAWAERLGCAPTTPAADAERYDRCRMGSAELWTIAGGGHQIATPEVLERVWGFLSRHVKPAP